MKYHLIVELLAAFLIGLIVITNNQYHRYLLLIPTLILFHVTLIVLMVEYDSLNIKQWKIKEKRLTDELTAKFLNNAKCNKNK
ncbi:MAG: hypothetical protein ABIG89_07570 [Candidatus Woesearchaeota archaeon]